VSADLARLWLSPSKGENTGDKDQARFTAADLTEQGSWAKDLPALVSGCDL
jgi:hypothetical protein